MKRQRVRKGIIFFSFLLFPVVMNFMSPALIIMGAGEGIVVGSMILFTLQFLSALFLGRT